MNDRTMSERAVKYEEFLDDLAPVVDGDPAAIERHADFLADDDEARDLRHEATGAAETLRDAGADYAPPADLEARVLAEIDAGAADSAEGVEDAVADAAVADAAVAGDAAGVEDAGVAEDVGDAEDVGRTTSPGFAAPDVARAELASEPAAGAEEAAPAADETRAPVAAEEDGVPTENTSTAATDSAPKRPRKIGKLLVFPMLGVGALAAAAAGMLWLFGGAPDDTPPEPTLATRGIDGTLEAIDRAADDGQSGVSIRRPGADAFVALSANEPAPAGSVLRTDERTRARLTLADGSELVLNHATELELVGEAPRSFRLREGELVADVAHLDGAPNASFATPSGRVEVLGTKFVLSATDEMTSVRVSRGVVSLSGADGEGADVRAGEEGLVRGGARPSVAPVLDLARSLAWSELGGEAEAAAADDADTLAGIGSLRARRPGERSDQERPLTLARHDVRVRVVGNVARTEIEEVFRNDGDHTLEGIYRFPLPPDAQIASLALDVDGRMEQGSFVERDRAAQIWRGVIRNATPTHQRDDSEEFIWVPGPWRDPAILEWQRGGRFELRIFPIPAHGERRVVLAYTQNVQPQGPRRRYVYPLAHSADDSTRVGEFSVDVRVAGAERVESSGYRVTSAAEGDATRLSLTQRDFTPKGDLVIDYELPGGERELRWWTYQGDAAVAPPENSRERDREVLDLQRAMASDERPYVAFALRPELPRATERENRDYVLVVDASQSMVGERYHRAAQLTAHLVGEMDRRDRFTVLACDYQCRAMPGGVQPPSAQAARQTREWLDQIEPAGASDLTAVLREAVATVSADRRDERELHVMYVGDGTSTVGYRRASSLAAETEALAREERVTVSTVGIGGDADTMALRALARSGGGHYVPYVPGERISVAALSVLETTYGASLESPRVELPDGLSESAPEQLPTIRAGQEVLVVARMERGRVEGDVVLRGTVAGRPFEQRYRVELVPTDAAGNRFVPRLWAAGRIEQLQLSGRGEDRARIIATSKSYGVLSRHTSLLVLESEAMFRAFRVDRREASQDWTGEEDVVSGEAEGQLQAALGGLGSTGYGRGAGGGLPRRRARRSRGPSLDSMGGGGGSGASSAPSARSRAMTGAEVLDGWSGDEDSSSDAMARDLRQRSEAATERTPAQNSWRWQDMPSPGEPRQPVARPAPAPRPPRRPGRWMRRERYRAAQIQPDGDASRAAERNAEQAEERLRENEDSRDRHRDAVRALARAGRIERALEVADAWIERDRLDPEALTAKADLLGRMGRRDDALRLLTGTVDLSPNSEPLHERLAAAFDRAGRPERACAHRIALAEIDEADAGHLAAAMRCERALSREQAAERLLTSIRDASVRTRAEREASGDDDARPFRGDFTVEAEWSGGSDVDVSIVTRQGTRLSWMGGRTTVVGEDATSSEREGLGLRWTAPGTYYIEVSRTDPSDTSEVRGRLEIRVLGQRRTVPFTLRGEREAVARVRVTRETRLVPVTGTVNR